MKRRYFLSVDGGGTKLQMILFDDEFRILGEGRSGGVNLNSTTAEDAKANVSHCLEQVFSSVKPDHIEKIFYVFVGRDVFLTEALNNLCGVKEAVRISEPEAGLLAGALWHSGLLALSGTGSDVFLVSGTKPPLRQPPQGRRAIDRMVVGGWGPILGDDGSGAWIGHRAIRAAIAGLEGWAPPTDILRLIRRDWGIKEDWEIVELVYRSPYPFRLLGSLTKIVEEAAWGEDKVACGIIEEAGHLLAIQTICLLNRYHVPPEDHRLVCCGGAWKTHPLMYETFRNEVHKVAPALFIRRPRFEPVMVGPVIEMLKTYAAKKPDGTLSADTIAEAAEAEEAEEAEVKEAEVAEAEARLAELFPKYIIYASTDY